MHYNWIIYPEGLRKLRESGLEETIKERLKKKDVSLCPNHFFEPEEALAMFEDLEERGYFETVPFDFVKNFGVDIYQDWHATLKRMVLRISSDEQDFFWQINRHKEKQKESVELSDDFPILSGLNASAVLTPTEFWQFRKFGFESLGDFLGTVGAFARMQDKSYLDKGYRWNSKRGNQTLETEITGSEHGDFRLIRRDVTPYQTIDPVGTPVLFRPETSEDATYLSASHSVEPHLLAIILKWIEQQKLPSEILKNPEKFLDEITSLPQYAGNFADFGQESIGGPRFGFIGWEMPLRRTDDLTNPRWMPDCIHCYGADSGIYVIRVGTERQLVFTYSDKTGKLNESETEILPDDADQMIRGLFTQAQRGLGRTSVKQLIDVMNYRFSKEFEKDREEERARTKK